MATPTAVTMAVAALATGYIGVPAVAPPPPPPPPPTGALVQYITHDGDAVGNVPTSSAPNGYFWNTVLEQPWQNVGGDWLDSAQTTQGSVPYASTAAVATVGQRLTANVTTLVQRWRTNGLNRGFFLRLERGRPFVTLKTGMSLDGKIALANGQSQWITSEAARADVQRLRARSCAVLTGIGTALADDPALTVRDPRFDIGGTSPWRVVLDAALRLMPGARLFADSAPVLVLTASVDEDRRSALVAAGARVDKVPAAAGGLDLHAVLQRLGTLAFNELLVECGPQLAGALLTAGLVDELVCHVAPKLLGAGARSAYALAEPGSLGDCPALEIVEVGRIGPDLRVVARPVPA